MLSNNFVQLSIELTIGFIILLISVKIIGKRQISQMTPFDFISAIVMGELLGNAIYDEKIHVLFIIYSVTLWTILLLIIEKVTQKSHGIRSKLQGTPSFIIIDGKIQFQQIKSEGLDINEVLVLMRKKDVFSIKDIDYALFETSGDITFIEKANSGKPTLCLVLIFDGNILKNNLKLIEKNKTWLLQELGRYNIKNMNEVLYAEYDIKSKNFYIQKY